MTFKEYLIHHDILSSFLCGGTFQQREIRYDYEEYCETAEVSAVWDTDSLIRRFDQYLSDYYSGSRLLRHSQKLALAEEFLKRKKRRNFAAKLPLP